MAYKVVTPLKHDNVEYKADDTVELAADVAADLLRDGIVQDLDAPDEQQTPATPPAPDQDNGNDDDQDLERGQADEQVVDNVQKDLDDAAKLADTPGDPVVNNSAKPGLGAKLRAAATAVVGQPAAPANPPADTPPADFAPTADEIAADPQLQDQ